MKRLALSTVGVLLACCAATGASAASLLDMETKVVAPDGTAYTVWIGPSFFSAPVANGLGSVGDSEPYDFQEQTDNGARLPSFGGSGGADMWFSRLGKTFYGAIDGDFAAANSVTTVTTTFDDFVDVLPITGEPSEGAAFEVPAGAAVRSATTVNYGRVTGEFAYGLVSGPDSKLAIGGLVSVGGVHLKSNVTPDPAGADFISLDETIRMTSFGPVVSASYEKPLQGNATLVLSGRAAALLAHGILSASQASTESDTTYSASDDATALAGLIEATAGVRFQLKDNLAVTLSGTAGARNDYFSIVNPRSAPGLDNNDPLSYHPEAVHLAQGTVFTGSVRIGLHGTF